MEEMKEVDLRSRPAQFIYGGNFTPIGLKPRAHAPSRLPVKKSRRLLMRKVRAFLWKGIRKISFLSIKKKTHNLLIYLFAIQKFYFSRSYRC